MLIKGIQDEDFVNYKKPSMLVAFPNCSFKCDEACGERVCHNGALALTTSIDVDVEAIIERYLSNPITKAMVCGGLEPFDSFEDLKLLLYGFIKACSDDFVIYTGYTEGECEKNGWLKSLRYMHRFTKYKNRIIIKFGRYVPGHKPHYDELLGVNLASHNQYAMDL